MIKKYIPNEKEKYMSEKQKSYFKKRLVDWKNEKRIHVRTDEQKNTGEEKWVRDTLTQKKIALSHPF